MDYTSIKTLGQLKASGYTPRSVKDEIRKPDDMDRQGKTFQASLAMRIPLCLNWNPPYLPSITFSLGLRGQAKTRIARLITQLMDEQIPVIEEVRCRGPFNNNSRMYRESRKTWR